MAIQHGCLFMGTAVLPKCSTPQHPPSLSLYLPPRKLLIDNAKASGTIPLGLKWAGFVRPFSLKPAGNDATEVDLSAINLCVAAMEGKNGNLDKNSGEDRSPPAVVASKRDKDWRPDYKFRSPVRTFCPDEKETCSNLPIGYLLMKKIKKFLRTIRQKFSSEPDVEEIDRLLYNYIMETRPRLRGPVEWYKYRMNGGLMYGYKIPKDELVDENTTNSMKKSQAFPTSTDKGQPDTSQRSSTTR